MKRKDFQLSVLTKHEMRILRYLDNHGPTHRETLVVDLASDKSRIAERAAFTKSGRRFIRGSNGATPMISANWTKRLVENELVAHHRDRNYFHIAYAITNRGRAWLRAEE
jgi:hypothetical protein